MKTSDKKLSMYRYTVLLLYRNRAKTHQDMRFSHASVNIVTLFCNRTDLRERFHCVKALCINRSILITMLGTTYTWKRFEVVSVCLIFPQSH